MHATAQSLDLYSRLFISGVTPALLPALQAHPELGRHFSDPLPPVSEQAKDVWAADHFHHFGMNVYPNAAVYLDSSGVLGGAINSHVLEFYNLAGFSAYSQSEGADHIGSELAFLSWLLAPQNLDNPDMTRTLTAFLGDHLLWWLPVFSLALDRQAQPLYSDAARSLQKAVFDLADRVSAPLNPPQTALEPENPLADPETRLKDIARFLLTPVQSGMLLTRDRISAVGRAFRLPRGFGDRLQIMHNLLRTAVDYEMVGELLGAVEEEVGEWEAHYQALAAEHSTGSPVAAFWLSRLATSRSLLQGMRLEIS